jgi:hypothetical protein
MMLLMPDPSKLHMFGADGMFWDREEVNWNPGSGPAAWQLLGRINKNRGALRICDFRRAQGFYVLFDEFRANYVGLARGAEGLGERLRRHNKEKLNWERFCWFAFDDVFDSDMDGWRGDAIGSDRLQAQAREQARPVRQEQLIERPAHPVVVE